MVAATGLTDPVLTRMVAEDKVPWYKKPNLRVMYTYLFLCCCGVEMTSGFDSQLINTWSGAEVSPSRLHDNLRASSNSPDPSTNLR